MTAELKPAKLHTYCKFCKANGVKRVANWMTRYAPRFGMRDTYKHYACTEHKHLIEDTDPNRTRAADNAELAKARKEVDDHMTEADYQTWGRL